jgi:hypothetical protein
MLTPTVVKINGWEMQQGKEIKYWIVTNRTQ